MSWSSFNFPQRPKYVPDFLRANNELNYERKSSIAGPIYDLKYYPSKQIFQLDFSKLKLENNFRNTVILRLLKSKLDLILNALKLGKNDEQNKLLDPVMLNNIFSMNELVKNPSAYKVTIDLGSKPRIFSITQPEGTNLVYTVNGTFNDITNVLVNACKESFGECVDKRQNDVNGGRKSRRQTKSRRSRRRRSTRRN